MLKGKFLLKWYRIREGLLWGVGGDGRAARCSCFWIPLLFHLQKPQWLFQSFCYYYALFLCIHATGRWAFSYWKVDMTSSTCTTILARAPHTKARQHWRVCTSADFEELKNGLLFCVPRSEILAAGFSQPTTNLPKSQTRRSKTEVKLWPLHLANPPRNLPKSQNRRRKTEVKLWPLDLANPPRTLRRLEKKNPVWSKFYNGLIFILAWSWFDFSLVFAWSWIDPDLMLVCLIMVWTLFWLDPILVLNWRWTSSSAQSSGVSVEYASDEDKNHVWFVCVWSCM